MGTVLGRALNRAQKQLSKKCRDIKCVEVEEESEAGAMLQAGEEVGSG
jgi:hypothetical protein